MIQTVLWDVDGTLLNFQAAEREALAACFARFGLGELTPERLARYSAINQEYWRRLERGEMTRSQILLGRFAEFFALEGIPCPDLEQLNGAYQVLLGDTVVFQEGAYELVRDLRGTVRQYAVTNGTQTAQRRKLAKSGLDRLLDGVFISEQLGTEKPDPRFFQAVFDRIGPCPREEVLIVGDSLTSDMRGGNNAGLLCCWYNPLGLQNTAGVRLDWQITHLNQVRALVGALR